MQAVKKAYTTAIIALLIVPILMAAIPLASAATVSTVTVSVSPDMIATGGSVTITVTAALSEAATASETFDYSIEVTKPDGTKDTKTGTYTATGGETSIPISVTYPTDFTGAATDVLGSYSVTATVGGVEATEPVSYTHLTLPTN